MKIKISLENLRKISRVILVLGLILLIFSSFGGLKIDLSFQVVLLSLGIFLCEFTEKNHKKEVKKQEKLMLRLGTKHYSISSIFMIGSLILGISSCCYLILKGMQEVQWNRIYYFSPQYVTKLVEKYGFPDIGFKLGLILSASLLTIILFNSKLGGEK